MSIRYYPTRWGVIRHSSVCKDDFRNIRTDSNGVKLQLPALRSFHSAQTAFGHRLLLTGQGWRSCASQWANWRHDPWRFAHPNTTLHPQGLAIDVSQDQLGLQQIRNLLLARGWHQSRPISEPWHYSFRLTA